MMPERPRLGGLELDPLADLALPLLLVLSLGLTVWITAAAFTGWTGVRLVPGIGLMALLFGCESYLFTTVFAVREVDVPGALRWVELAVMLVLAKVLAALPAAGGVGEALTGAWESGAMWLGFALLAYAWAMGNRAARQLQYLHPGLLLTAPDQERLARDDHSRAFEQVRTLVFGQVAAVGALLGIGGSLAGDGRMAGWSWAGAGLLVLAALAAGAVLVAAQLKARITWMQERIEAAPQVFGRWAPMGLSLLLVPALLALILPAGPRLPAEALLQWLSNRSPRIETKPPQLPKQENPQPDGQNEFIRQMMKDYKPMQWHLPVWVWWVLGAIPVLWLLKVAAQQLSDRLKSGRLKGLWAALAVLAGWYLALWKAIGEAAGGVLRQAVATPAEALGALLGETGALGRYLPFHGRAPSEPRAALRYYFARLSREAGRKGLRRAPGATAAEYGQQLAAAAPEATAEIDGLVAAYEEARYSDELSAAAERVGFARRAWVSIARLLGRQRRP